MFDIAIIGRGPAGFSAAINAAARNKKAVLLGKDTDSSGLYKAERVDNYLGMHGISGSEMLKSYIDHAEKTGIESIIGRVSQIIPMGNYFSINIDNEIYNAKTIILATGLNKKNNNIPGEDELLGKGVSYCATCDGMFYKNRIVAVVANDKEAISDANFLSDICEKVYVFLGRGVGSDGLKEACVVMEGRISEIKGDDVVTAVVADNEEIQCNGVFIIRESIPVASLVYGLELSDGKITVDRNMNTNIKGIFAAGDCTGKPYQVAKAVGEGLVAALSASTYLDNDNS